MCQVAAVQQTTRKERHRKSDEEWKEGASQAGLEESCLTNLVAIFQDTSKGSLQSRSTASKKNEMLQLVISRMRRRMQCILRRDDDVMQGMGQVTSCKHLTFLIAFHGYSMTSVVPWMQLDRA